MLLRVLCHVKPPLIQYLKISKIAFLSKGCALLSQKLAEIKYFRSPPALGTELRKAKKTIVVLVMKAKLQKASAVVLLTKKILYTLLHFLLREGYLTTGKGLKRISVKLGRVNKTGKGQPTKFLPHSMNVMNNRLSAATMEKA